MRIILKKTGETANVPESYGRRMLEMGQAKLAKEVTTPQSAPLTAPLARGAKRKNSAKEAVEDEPERAD